MQTQPTLHRFESHPALWPDIEPDMRGLFEAEELYLRKIAERTVAGLMRALEACADIFKSAECSQMSIAN